MIRDPELLRQICIRDFECFRNHEQNPFANKNQRQFYIVWFHQLQDQARVQAPGRLLAGSHPELQETAPAWWKARLSGGPVQYLQHVHNGHRDHLRLGTEAEMRLSITKCRLFIQGQARPGPRVNLDVQRAVNIIEAILLPGFFLKSFKFPMNSDDKT